MILFLAKKQRKLKNEVEMKNQSEESEHKNEIMDLV